MLDFADLIIFDRTYSGTLGTVYRLGSREFLLLTLFITSSMAKTNEN